LRRMVSWPCIRSLLDYGCEDVIRFSCCPRPSCDNVERLNPVQFFSSAIHVWVGLIACTWQCCRQIHPVSLQ
jgi:hypothetical protein